MSTYVNAINITTSPEQKVYLGDNPNTSTDEGGWRNVAAGIPVTGVTRTLSDDKRIITRPDPDPSPKPQGNAIKMTDYYVHLHEVQHFLPTFSATANQQITWWRWLDGGGSAGPSHQWCRYDLVHGLDYIRSNHLDMNANEDYVNQRDIDVAVNEACKEVVTSLTSSFDFLTAMAEAKETMETILLLLKAVRSPLKTLFKAVKGRSGSNKLANIHKTATNAWMLYRYGVMPIMYQIQDAVNLLKDLKHKFYTCRATRTLAFKTHVPAKLPEAPLRTDEITVCYYTKKQTTIKITATGKAFFENVFQRFIDQVTINPALTLWELIPFSFVVDWFVDVGGTIECWTAGAYNAAAQQAFCYAIKREEVIEHYSYVVQNQKITRTVDHYGTASYGDVRSEHLLLAREYKDLYDRHVFTPGDIKLFINPFMNWKRWLDSYVLSLKPACKALRNIKRL